MKLFQKMIALCCTVAVMLSMAILPASAATAVNVAIDGTNITIPASYGAAYIDSASRTMIPIRAVSEALGATVAWDAATNTATINGSIKIKIGSNAIQNAYGSVTMDTTAVIKDGRTYLPFRYAAQAMGYDVTWDDSSKTANIITKSDLVMSAAASLKNALTDIQVLYLKSKPNAKVTINYGASGTLQTQIEQGASADLFFSAATSNMTALKNENLLNNDSVKNLLQNKLVMVVPSTSTLSISSFKDVTNSGITKLALGEPTSVPAGKYAQQVFTYYNLLDAAKAKVVYGKDVTQVLTWVAGENADAGVVYSTDAQSNSNVKVVATAPDDSHDPINYPVAVLKSTKQPIAAQDFLNFLTTDAAKAIFVKYGFTVL
jgi:molybdate transport system substrate-binding protein